MAKARSDNFGLIWQDAPVAEKRQPPKRTWEDPSYLPYIDDARRFNVKLFTQEELITAQVAKEILICDTEIYMNYFLVAFTSLASGKVIYFERRSTHDRFINDSLLSWILQRFRIVTFNGNDFDLPILAMAIHGCTTEEMKHAANQLIQQQLKPWIVLKQHKVNRLENIDHIDLIKVAPLEASLKLYGGRMHAPKMQELPFKESLTLTNDQICCVRWYCINSDLTATAFLYMQMHEQIALRESMSIRYGIDLRSKSDAQIAEAVICAELRRQGVEPSRVEIPDGTVVQYRVPGYIQFDTPLLQHVLSTVASAEFVIDENGYPELPEEIETLKIEINGAVYRMGLGGLHSSETCKATYADAEHLLFDRDVASYYPSLILNQKLFPKHLGPSFLVVYQTIVQRRLAAKASGNKVEADTLKIVANGSFGKFGSKYSTLYSPDLLLQVTLSGQLSLLMLIERLESAGIMIASANTDGVLIRPQLNQVPAMDAIVKQWEADTSLITEATEYSAIYNRDVNNYIAIKKKVGFKVKGDYAERGSTGDSILSKNPVNLICRDALVEFLMNGTPIHKTITECKNIRRFVSVRTVKGGAVKDGEYLGKAIRWYQSNEVTGEIIYASNGNKVPNSENCRPCMELPKEFPADVDLKRYEEQTLEMLREIGYY